MRRCSSRVWPAEYGLARIALAEISLNVVPLARALNDLAFECEVAEVCTVEIPRVDEVTGPNADACSSGLVHGALARPAMRDIADRRPGLTDHGPG